MELSPLIAGPLWVIHLDRERGPQWRHCHIRLVCTPERAILFAHVRRRSDGADITELFDSCVFRAALGSIISPILIPMLSRHAQETDVHAHNLLFSIGSRGAGTPTNGRSPYLSYTFDGRDSADLATLSLHARLAAQAAFNAAGDCQQRQRVTTRKHGIS